MQEFTCYIDKVYQHFPGPQISNVVAPKLFACLALFHVCLPSTSFVSTFFKKIIRSGTLPGCQTAWIQIRTDVQSVLIWVQTVCISKACADPESFVRRGPTLTSFFCFLFFFFFSFDFGRRGDPNNTKCGP